MNLSRPRITASLLCLALLLFPRPAKADSIQNAVVLASVGIAAAGAAIGIGVYYAIHHRSPAMTGCSSLSSDTLILRNEADQKIYTLAGDIADIKAGDRIKLSGKKDLDASGKRSFLVDKVVKDYGPCKVAP
jgi:hypothetical protein